MSFQTLCSISTLLEMNNPPALQGRTTLDLKATIQGSKYPALHLLDSSDLNIRITYYNEHSKKFKNMSSVICQGVLCVNDSYDSPPDLLVRASPMGLHVLPLIYV